MVNKRLIELAKRQMNPSLPKEKKPTKIQRKSNLTQILKKDENGKPKLNLIPIEKTAVNPITQEDYNGLMKVYECGGWKLWGSNRDLPTQRNDWESYQGETCIRIKDIFMYCDKKHYQNMGWKILSTKEFYDKQKPKITFDMIKEINQWFNEDGK